MHKFIFAVAALLSLSGAAFADGARPVIAEPAVAQSVAVQAAPQAEPVTLTCRLVFHDGTVINNNDCRTQTEWDNKRVDQQRQITDFQNRAHR